MRSALSNLLATVRENITFSPDWFAEPVTVQPEGQASRTVYVNITTDWETAENDGGSDETETIKVHCARDESATYGGIARPSIGLAITRSATYDPDPANTPYLFERASQQDADPAEWILLFSRIKRYRQEAAR